LYPKGDPNLNNEICIQADDVSLSIVYPVASPTSVQFVTAEAPGTNLRNDFTFQLRFN